MIVFNSVPFTRCAELVVTALVCTTVVDAIRAD